MVEDVSWLNGEGKCTTMLNMHRLRIWSSAGVSIKS